MARELLCLMMIGSEVNAAPVKKLSQKHEKQRDQEHPVAAAEGTRLRSSAQRSRNQTLRCASHIQLSGFTTATQPNAASFLRQLLRGLLIWIYACCKYQRQSCSPTSPINCRYSEFFTARYTFKNSGPKASLAHTEACSARKVVSQSVGSISLAWA